MAVAMTKLQAVNRILAAVAETSADALDTGGSSAVGIAEAELDKADLDYQSEGWHFNTIHNVELEPDGSDEIVLDSDVIIADTSGYSGYIDVAQIGGKLYNRIDQTYEFSANVYCTLVKQIAFTDLPLPIQQAIVAVAAYNMEFTTSEDSGRLRVLYDAKEKALAIAARYDGNQSNTTMMHTPFGRAARGAFITRHFRRY